MEKKMNRDKLLGNILERLAKNSVSAVDHKKRRKADGTAYAIIREFCDDDKVKYWDDYYQTAKRCL